MFNTTLRNMHVFMINDLIDVNEGDNRSYPLPDAKFSREDVWNHLFQWRGACEVVETGLGFLYKY